MQNQPSPQPAPAAPPTPRAVTVTTSEGGQPVTIRLPQGAEALTLQELEALRIRQDALGEQLSLTQRRRTEVAEQIRVADEAARPGLQEQLAVLDQRILRIEGEIAETGQQLASVPAALATAIERGSRPRGGGGEEEEAYFGGLATAAVFIGFYALYRRIRRGRRPARQPALAGDREQLTRLEQAVDAIALEVERIAEGQRFTAKLMAETHDRRMAEVAARNASEPR